MKLPHQRTYLICGLVLLLIASVNYIFQLYAENELKSIVEKTPEYFRLMNWKKLAYYTGKVINPLALILLIIYLLHPKDYPNKGDLD